MSDADANLVLLPWLRRGGSGAVTRSDTLGPDQPGIATATASLAVNDAPPVSVDVRLMGPGHVTGLQTAQVIRMDPTPGSRSFEPNYFALIEFDEPSLPWLFTPAAANDAQRLRPWLCLVVVRKQPGVQISPPRRGAMPVLTIASPADPNAELPDLADSWAWAHAQVTGELPSRGSDGETDASVAALEATLRARPDLTLSRLVCARVLDPVTDYLACVVPTFELGRLAGLGVEVPAEEEAQLRPAWTRGDALRSVELPVYHSWEFATGINGDFQALAALLRARPLPTGVGSRSIDVSASGVGVPVPVGTTLPLGGALQPLPPPPPDDAGSAGAPEVPLPGAGWPTEGLHDAFRTSLAELLNAPDATTDDDPLLAPPRYSSTQSGLTALDPSRRDRWYEQLNLEPPARVSAQFGARVVQEQQEALVASAWEQAAELRRVNELVRRVQFRVAVDSSIHRRHLATMAADSGLQALGPLHAQLAVATQDQSSGFAAMIRATQVPPAAFGTAMRRIARPQGAIARRAARAATSPIGPAVAPPPPDGPPTPTPRRRTVLTSLQPGAVTIRDRSVGRGDGPIGGGIVGPPLEGMVTIERVARGLIPQRTDIEWDEATAAAISGAPPRPNFAFTIATPPVDTPPPSDPRPADPRPVDPLPADPDPVEPRPRPRPRPRPFPDGGGGPRPVEPFAAVRRRPVDQDGDGIPDFPPDPEPEPEPEPEPDPEPRPEPVDSPAAAAFRAAAAAHLARFEPSPPQPPGAGATAMDTATVFGQVLELTAPRATFAARLELLVDRGVAGPSPGSLSMAGPAPVLFTPRFPQPLAPVLGAMDQDMMLPGLDLVPPNTVVPLRTNSAFVDAVLAGFNTELGRELVWREFPTPLQTTYADRFWDPGASDRPPDIPPLSDWGDRPLGGPLAATDPPGGGERFVVLLRSELLRRYPDAVVYAVKPDTPPALPILTGSMDPDVRFFGFDIAAEEIGGWAIVIAEQPTAPRFGVDDLPELPAGATHLPLVAADHDAARLAVRLRQHPVRVTIPATVLLADHTQGATP